MCGIVGFFSGNKRTDSEVLISMRDALSHRGPDDMGSYIDIENKVGLAHRRLSILDLSPLGHQPMSNEEGSIWVAYNGEIYNFKELREELIQIGYRFKSNSDTEVLVKAFEQWGIECINRFIGMFAIAIWDKRTKKLYLIRDRAGVKPLYYYRRNGVFLFGSELKALMKHPDFHKEIDFNILPLYLRYGFISSPYTIFKDTFKIKPGHYLCVSNNSMNEVKYWDIADYYNAVPLSKSEDELTEELEDILIDSFKYRLVSDVPVGVFLSGGIDSTIVTTLLQKNIGSKLKTFTIGFIEDRFNEAESAKKIAKFLGTEHTEYYLSEKDAFEIIDKLPEIYDEPFGDQSAIPTYLVSKLARREVKVALSADGGDELFCGYRRYRSIFKIKNFISNYPSPIKKMFMKTLSSISPDRVDNIYRSLSFLAPRLNEVKDTYIKWRNMLQEYNDGNIIGMYRYNLSKWNPVDIFDLMNKDLDVKFDNEFEDAFHGLENVDLISQMMAADYKTYLADDILTKVDRATMSVGLEGREPFLDHRVAEYVARIPLSLKFKNGNSKYIIKKILKKHLPEALFKRPKQGFVVPLDKWLKGEMYPLVMNYLDKDRLAKEGIFNADRVSFWLKEFYSGSSIYASKIWFLLMFEMWKERWV